MTGDRPGVLIVVGGKDLEPGQYPIREVGELVGEADGSSWFSMHPTEDRRYALVSDPTSKVSGLFGYAG